MSTTSRLLFGISLTTAAFAQLPAERIGRVSFVHGAVSYRPGAVQEWGPASLNLPLTDGDHLWTDADSQAEVRAGAIAVHLAPHTGYSVIRLDARSFRMGLS